MTLSITDKYALNTVNAEKQYSIAEAVDAQLCRNGERSGVAENALALAEANARLIGRLVHTLHGNGNLTTGDVAEMLTSFRVRDGA